MRLAAVTLSFLVVGCAAQPERKMSFNLVFHAPDQLASPQPLPAAAPASPEAARILRALERAGGSRERAAQVLGWSRVTLWRRMRELGLEPAKRRG